MKKIDAEVDFDPSTMKLQYEQAVKHVRKQRTEGKALTNTKAAQPGNEEIKLKIEKSKATNAVKHFDEDDEQKDLKEYNKMFQFHLNKGKHLAHQLDQIDAGHRKRPKPTNTDTKPEALTRKPTKTSVKFSGEN